MTETGTRTLSWLRNAVVGVFVLAIVAGIFMPVYTDEVGWRLQERAAFDGVDKLFTQICGPNTLARPPFWMMPVRYYSALFNSLFADPLYVRLSGILYALVWTGMVLALIRRAAGGARQRLELSILAVGFLSLGTMPLLLVWSRPEQPIVLALTGALLIAFSDWNQGSTGQPRAETSAGTAWLRSLLLLLLAAVALSYHVKALFTIPLFLACLCFASHGRAAHVSRLAAAALMVAATAWAAHYWVHRLECPNDPAVNAMFASNNTGAALVGASDWSQILPLIRRAIDNISLFQYLGMPAPRERPISAWLPMDQIGFSASFSWFLALVVLWSIALSLSAHSLASAARRAWRERKLDARAILAVMLMAAILGWSVTQGYRNPYEAIFVVPLAVMAVVLMLATRQDGAPFGAPMRLFAAGVGLLGIASVLLIGALYGPLLVRAAGERGYIKTQPFSVSAFGYAGLRRDMLAAARRCGIVDPDRKHALVLDDVTYFTFMKSRMPEHSYGVFPPVPLREPIGYLKGIRSDGIVASCQVLPWGIQARAKREGQFCCLAPPDW